MKTQDQPYLINDSPSAHISSELSDLDKQLLNNFQHEFPGSNTPYADLAQELGVSEQEVIKALQRLTRTGAVSRVGAVFQPKRIGISTLVAMAVPARQLQEVARIVSSYVSVNHNYEREHHYNLWFVVTAADSEQLEKVLSEIQSRSGLPVLSLPMLENYHIDLGFKLHWGQKN